MRTSFSIPAITGTYTSPIYNVTTLNNYNNEVSFEFYDDIALTVPSVGMTGSLTVNGKMSKNSLWQNLPNTSIPSTVDISVAYSLGCIGTIYQLQIITSNVMNANYINIIIDSSKST